MDKLVTPDCPQCGGRGFLRDGFNTFPCGQCRRRYDLANPHPSPKFMATDTTMAEFVKGLRAQAKGLEEIWTAPDWKRRALAHGTLELLLCLRGAHFVEHLRLAADFIASHDPSTKVYLTEAEAPYCNACEFDHVPGACGL